MIKSQGGTSSIVDSSKNLKVKLKIKKGEKGDPKKILEKIGQIGRPENNLSKMNNSEDYGTDSSKLDYVIAPDNINDELVLGHSYTMGNK
jgi:predicted transport protein